MPPKKTVVCLFFLPLKCTLLPALRLVARYGARPSPDSTLSLHRRAAGVCISFARVIAAGESSVTLLLARSFPVTPQVILPRPLFFADGLQKSACMGAEPLRRTWHRKRAWTGENTCITYIHIGE